MVGWHHWLNGHWVWVNSRSWWWTGRPGVLQSMASQSRTWLSNWTELNWTDIPWAGTRTLLYSHTILSELLLLCFCIIFLPWLVTVWICPLVLREGLEAEAFFLQIRNWGHKKDLYLGGSHRVSISFNKCCDSKVGIWATLLVSTAEVLWDIHGVNQRALGSRKCRPSQGLPCPLVVFRWHWATWLVRLKEGPGIIDTKTTIINYN